MNKLSDIPDDELIAEINRRRTVKRAESWSKIEKIQKELSSILFDAKMLDMHWSSTDVTIEQQAEDFFGSLRGACGGNDIQKILKEKK